MAVFILQLFSGCDDGLTYDEQGQVVSGQPHIDSIQQAPVSDSIAKPDKANYQVTAPPLETNRTLQIPPALILKKRRRKTW